MFGFLYYGQMYFAGVPQYNFAATATMFTTYNALATTLTTWDDKS